MCSLSTFFLSSLLADCCGQTPGILQIWRMGPRTGLRYRSRCINFLPLRPRLVGMQAKKIWPVWPFTGAWQVNGGRKIWACQPTRNVTVHTCRYKNLSPLLPIPFAAAPDPLCIRRTRASILSHRSSSSPLVARSTPSRMDPFRGDGPTGGCDEGADEVHAGGAGGLPTSATATAQPYPAPPRTPRTAMRGPWGMARSDSPPPLPKAMAEEAAAAPRCMRSGPWI
jgi:hypothetical protein